MECLNPTKMKLKDYLLTSALIVIVGGAMYIGMKMFHIDPMWSVAKAEYYCTVTHGVRHKHNVWATFVRSANTLLGEFHAQVTRLYARPAGSVAMIGWNFYHVIIT